MKGQVNERLTTDYGIVGDDDGSLILGGEGITIVGIDCELRVARRRDQDAECVTLRGTSRQEVGG